MTDTPTPRPAVPTAALRVLRRWVVTAAMLPALAAVAQPAPMTPAAPAPLAAPAGSEPLKEIAVAATAFVRGAPLPAWADLLPLPAPAATRRAVVLRLEDTHLLVAATPVQLVNVAEQVNDPAALSQIGQIAIRFIPQYQRLLLHRAVILRGDQVIDHTATVQVRFLQREAGLEQGIYSGVITASLLLPDVRVGDTLHLQYSIEGENPIFGGRYVQQALWDKPVPVQQRRLTLTAPESRRILWKWLGDGPPSTLEPVVTTSNGMRRLRFEQAEVPPVELEPLLPRGAVPLRLLQFSEFADWADVARWADALFPADAPVPPELVPVLTKLLRVQSTSEQASQALQWVQSQIRYYSVSLGESSHRPHLPEEVLRNRYGDCKDKTLLLMRMLQSLGIPARAVLASLGAPQAPARQLASPFAFDHAVVQARIDGRDVYLDATRLGQRGPVERMGQGQEGASVLVVDPATRDLTTVRSPNRDELFRGELTEKFRVDAFDADGELDTLQQWNGLGAEVIRLTAARLDTGRLQQAMLGPLERRYPGITVIGQPEFTDEVDKNRISLHARFKVPKLATAVDGRWVVRYAPANMMGSFAVPPSMTRRLPLGLPSFPGTIVYNAEVQWPQNVSVLPEPTSQQISNPYFAAETSRSARGSLARASLHFQALAPSVPGSEVRGFFDDARKMERGVGNQMTVAAGQVKDGGFLGIGRKTLQDTLQASAQATVERTDRSIASGQLSGDDLAQALCLRADAQAQLGRAPLAAKDAEEAVKRAPSLASAWLCRGNANWAQGEFATAEADFGKSLALGQNPAEAYLRRGHARFYAGRYEQAADDFAKAASDRPEATERLTPLLWQAWSLQRLGRPLPADLQALAAADPQGVWPRPALALAAGLATPDQVLALVERKTGDDRDLALAEAWFDIGQYRLAQQQPQPAREAFEKSRALRITPTVEYAASAIELQRLGARP